MIERDIEFESGNIRFNLLKKGDIKDIADMLENPAVGKYLYFCPSPREVYEGYFQGILSNMDEAFEKGSNPKSYDFILRDKNTNEFIGECGIISVDFVEGVYEVGYQLREEYWGKGIGTLAGEFMIYFAMEYLDFHRLSLDAYKGNEGSWKAAEKIGFQKECELRKYYRVEGGFDSKVLYGLLREDIGNFEELSLKFKRIK